MENFQVEELLDNLSLLKLDLASLDPSLEPERRERCDRAVADLQGATAATLSAWIPRDPQALIFSIRFVNDNIRNVRSRIDEVFAEVENRKQPDECLRLSCAFGHLRLLEVRREIMMDVLAKIIAVSETQGLVN